MDNTSGAEETLLYQLMNNAPHDLFWTIVSIVITFLVTYAIAYYFSPMVRIKTRTWKIKLGSEDVRYNLFFKYYYTRKTNNLNANVYRKIKTKFSEYNISRASIRPEAIIINPEKLGVKISIEIDCINELEAEELSEVSEEKRKEYQLTIRLDSGLRLTYKRLDILGSYLNMFEEIKEIVEDECFGGEKGRKPFLVCDLIRDYDVIYTGEDIVDNTQNIKIYFMGRDVKIIADKPTLLISTIKKYMGY